MPDGTIQKSEVETANCVSIANHRAMVRNKTQLPLSKPSRSLKTRQLILEACARQFSQRGYHGVSNRELARDAGINEVTLFRHFANKAEIYKAVLVDQINQLDLRDAFLSKISRSGNLNEARSHTADALQDAMARLPQLGNLLLYSFLDEDIVGTLDLRMLLKRALSPLIIALSVWGESRGLVGLNPHLSVMETLAQVIARHSLLNLTRPKDWD
jgi:TetR/AcrR family transcriptional regulator, mexJK operon transcriptional repressor